MEDNEKLEKVLSALVSIALSTTDYLVAKYCAIILKEVEEFNRISDIAPDKGKN